MGKLYNLQEAAERLTVSESTVRRLINQGKLRAYKVGAQLRIADEDLTAYLRSCLIPLPPPPKPKHGSKPAPAGRNGCGYYPGMKVV